MPRNPQIPGSEARARTRLWYEENSPGQIRTVQNSSFPSLTHQVPILEVRDFGAPLAIVLQLDREYVNRGIGGPAVAYGIRARIAWGCGGASDFFECDWAEGGLINLVAQRLTVTAHAFDSDPNLGFNMGDDIINLSAAVGHGNAEGIHPFYSDPFQVDPATSAPRVRPPAWAKACSILAYSDAATDPYDPAANQWHVLVTRNNFLPMARFDNYSLAAGAAFPVSSDMGVVITNQGAARISGNILWHIGT